MSGYQTAAAENVALRSSPIDKKAILAASLGTALEWYDVFLYLSFSLTISKLFFPAANQFVSLLATAGTFGVSYLMKPLGALVLSSYADRVSRKSALTVTLSLMAVGIAMTAFAPTYSSIGALATVIMIVARFIQGFCPVANTAPRRRFWWSGRRHGIVDFTRASTSRPWGSAR